MRCNCLQANSETANGSAFCSTQPSWLPSTPAHIGTEPTAPQAPPARLRELRVEGGGHEGAAAHRHHHAVVPLRRGLLCSQLVLGQHLHACGGWDGAVQVTSRRMHSARCSTSPRQLPGPPYRVRAHGPITGGGKGSGGSPGPVSVMAGARMNTARKVSLASVLRGRHCGAGSCVSKLLICSKGRGGHPARESQEQEKMQLRTGGQR